MVSPMRHRRTRLALSAWLALTLAWPSPVFALRPAGLEESGAKPALTETLAGSGREAARQRIIASLRQHPGGRTDTVTLAQAADMSRWYWYKVGGLDLLDAENAARLEENVLRRAHDQPLRSLIIRRTSHGFYHARTTLREVLQQAPGYFLPPGEATRQADVSVGKTGASNYGYAALAREETGRRSRANLLRQAMRKSPIPRIGTTLEAAAAYVLEDQPGGFFPAKELDRILGVNSFRPTKVRPLYAVQNDRRVAERESRKASNQPWRRLALTIEEAIQFAIEEHPGGQVTDHEFAAFAGVSVRALWELGYRSGGEGYRQRIAAKNPDRIKAGLPPILIVSKPYAPILHRARRDAAGLEEISSARWKQLVEGRTGRGLLVVASSALEDRALYELLKRMPDALSNDVMIWGGDPAAVSLKNDRMAAGAAPIRRLQSFLPWLHDVARRVSARAITRIGVIDGPRDAVPSLQTLGEAVTVQEVASLPLAPLFDTLGVPEPVLRQIPVEELAREIAGTRGFYYEKAARVLRDFRGGYFQKKELAAAIGANASQLSPSSYDLYRPLITVENERRTRINLSRRLAGQPLLPRIATSAREAIEFAIEDHPGGKVTAGDFATFANIRFWTLEHAHYKGRLAAGNARRLAEQPPRPAIEIVYKPYTQVLYSGPRGGTAGVSMRAGLEEISAARWRALAEGRTGRGVVVIPTRLMSKSPEIRAFLEALPQELLEDVLLWFDGDKETVWPKNRTDLAVHYEVPDAPYATGFADDLEQFVTQRGVTRIAMLSDDPAEIEKLQDGLRRLDSPLVLTPLTAFDWKVVLEALGVDKGLLEQMGLEELQGARYVGSGT